MKNNSLYVLSCILAGGIFHSLPEAYSQIQPTIPSIDQHESALLEQGTYTVTSEKFEKYKFGEISPTDSEFTKLLEEVEAPPVEEESDSLSPEPSEPNQVIKRPTPNRETTKYILKYTECPSHFIVKADACWTDTTSFEPFCVNFAKISTELCELAKKRRDNLKKEQLQLGLKPGSSYTWSDSAEGRGCLAADSQYSEVTPGKCVWSDPSQWVDGPCEMSFKDDNDLYLTSQLFKPRVPVKVCVSAQSSTKMACKE